MFGKHFEAAEATVLFVEILNSFTNTEWQPYQFILEVRTQSGQTLRTTVKEHFVLFNHPEVGDVVKVQYDPKSQQVKLDTKGDIRYDVHAKELARKAQRDAILSAPAGTPLPGRPCPELRYSQCRWMKKCCNWPNLNWHSITRYRTNCRAAALKAQQLS
jgi:hypothetical protein